MRVRQLKNTLIQKREVGKYTKTRSENETNIKTITKYADTKKSTHMYTKKRPNDRE